VSSFASQVRALVSSSSVALVFAALLAYVRKSKPVHDGLILKVRRNIANNKYKRSDDGDGGRVCILR